MNNPQNTPNRASSKSNEVKDLPSDQDFAFLDIILEDGPVIAVNKPAGMLSQGAPRGSFCLPDYVKAYLKKKYEKSGNVYLGVIHRLDRPVTGVTIFSRNSKCAARLSEQFRERQVQKTYLAIVEGDVQPEQGNLVDWIHKVPNQARAELSPTESDDAKKAELSYSVLGKSQGLTFLEVKPITGRMHQIRLQFSSRGYPVLGDQLYGATRTIDLKPLQADYTDRIGLHAWKLQLRHPVRYDPLEISAPLPADWSHFTQHFIQTTEK